MTQIEDGVEDGDRTLLFDLLNQMIDGHQSARLANSGATVDQDGSTVGAVIFVQAAYKA